MKNVNKKLNVCYIFSDFLDSSIYSNIVLSYKD